MTDPQSGFTVIPVPVAGRVSWTVMVSGPNPWFVSGFHSRRSALGWVLDYLTTVNENHARLLLEEAERRRESDERSRLAQAALLEPVAKKGMEN